MIERVDIIAEADGIIVAKLRGDPPAAMRQWSDCVLIDPAEFQQLVDRAALGEVVQQRAREIADQTA